MAATQERLVSMPSYASKKRLHLSGAAYAKPVYEDFVAYFDEHYGRKPVGAEIMEWSRQRPEQWRADHPEEEKRRRR